MTRELFSILLGGSTMNDCTPYDCAGDMRTKARLGGVYWEARL